MPSISQEDSSKQDDMPGRSHLSPPPIIRRMTSLPAIISTVLAALFLVFIVTRFNVDPSTIWSQVTDLNPLILALAVGVHYTTFVFRGARWRLLLQNASPHNHLVPGVVYCSQLVLLGWFANSVGWLRLGDAYRAYAFAEDSGQSFSWSLGTVLAERIMDMFSVFVLILIGVAFFSVTYNSDGMLYVLTVAFVMVLGLGMLLVLMKQYGRKMVRIVPVRFQKAYDRFQQGTFGSFKQIPLLFILVFFVICISALVVSDPILLL